MKILLVLCGLLIFFPGVSWAECTESEKADLVLAGKTEKEIVGICAKKVSTSCTQKEKNSMLAKGIPEEVIENRCSSPSDENNQKEETELLNPDELVIREDDIIEQQETEKFKPDVTSKQPALIIGVGLGKHQFYQNDDLRDDTPDWSNEKTDSVNSANLIQTYLEWYGEKNSDWGFGLKYIQLDEKRKTEQNSGGNKQEIKETYNISSTFANFIYKPFKTENSFIGLTGGIGHSNYKYKKEVDTDSSDSEAQDNKNGGALLAGVFLDIGGKGVGVRLGAQSINAYHPKMNLDSDQKDQKLDISGSSFYLDLRMGF